MCPDSLLGWLLLLLLLPRSPASIFLWLDPSPTSPPPPKPEKPVPRVEERAVKMYKRGNPGQGGNTCGALLKAGWTPGGRRASPRGVQRGFRGSPPAVPRGSSDGRAHTPSIFVCFKPAPPFFPPRPERCPPGNLPHPHHHRDLQAVVAGTARAPHDLRPVQRLPPGCG